MDAKLIILGFVCFVLAAGQEASNRFDDCQRPCPMNLDYVCGTDGKTYPNMCSLSVAACNARKEGKPEIHKAYRGKCGNPPAALKDKPRPSFYQMTPEIQKKLEEKKSKNNCLRPCPRNFDFVCASDGRTYSNPCVMQVEACEQQKSLTIAHKGPCPNGKGSGALLQMLMTVKEVCPVMCPANYAPVCGDNDKTYPNECALKYEGCRTKTLIRTAYSGPCKTFYRPPKRVANETKDTEPDDCNMACPFNLDYVCGTDGVTYPNLCSMESTACRKRLDVKLAHKGKC